MSILLEIGEAFKDEILIKFFLFLAPAAKLCGGAE